MLNSTNAYNTCKSNLISAPIPLTPEQAIKSVEFFYFSHDNVSLHELVSGLIAIENDPNRKFIERVFDIFKNTKHYIYRNTDLTNLYLFLGGKLFGDNLYKDTPKGRRYFENSLTIIH